MSNIQHHQVIIIGSGPAGLTAALYCARSGIKPLVFEGAEPGGQLMGTALVENWPGNQKVFGAELIIAIKSHAESFGTQCIMDSIEHVDISKRPFIVTSAENGQYSCDSLIIATGASHKKLGCKGEQEYWGHGVTTCAVCDGAFYKDQPVVIAGGGNSGAENALFMTKFSNDITIVHRSENLSASYVLQERIKKSAIKVMYNSIISEINGDGEKVTGVVVKNSKTSETQSLNVKGVFVSIGTLPNSIFIKDQLETDQYGYIVVKDHGVHTSVPGVFVAGDVANPYHRQAIVASGRGCIAALEAEKFLHEIIKN